MTTLLNALPLCEQKLKTPNAQVQGRALGMAEAMRCIGVPCNAQLGAGYTKGMIHA